MDKAHKQLIFGSGLGLLNQRTVASYEYSCCWVHLWVHQRDDGKQTPFLVFAEERSVFTYLKLSFSHMHTVRLMLWDLSGAVPVAITR